MSLEDLRAFTAQPDDDWQLLAADVSVSGEQFRLTTVTEFVDAVSQALQQKQEIGIHLEREPDNPASPHAVKVVGYIRGRLLPAERSFHIGYLDDQLRETIAAQLPDAAPLMATLAAIAIHQDAEHADDPVNIIIDVYTAPE